MNIGIDLHDTLTYAPEFFSKLLKTWPGNKYIVTGTPARDAAHAMKIVRDLGVEVDGIFMGFDFEKSNMGAEHFKKMAQHKLEVLKTAKVSVYFDDNPFYAEFMRHHGIVVFQTIVSPAYLEAYRAKDSYFSCHLQERQFSFLEKL